jgi:glycosyltransferase involved in cell wall biosynthesis
MFPRVGPLRDKGIDVHLYVGYTRKNSRGEPVPDPGQDPRQLTGESYEWVHYLDFGNQLLPFFYNLNILSDYDILHSCTMAPIVNQFFLQRGQKLIALATGSDLREFAARRGIKPALLRRAYRRARLLLYQDLDEGTVAALENLGLTRKSRHLEYLIDFPEVSPEPEVGSAEDTFRIFYPNLLLDRVKGTTIFLEALAKLAQTGREFKVVMIDHGADRLSIREKITTLGLAEFIQWHAFCQLADMARLYQSCDAVIGYFRFGELGVPHYPQVLLEGCHFGKAVVSSYDDAVISSHYEDFPVLQASSHDEVLEHMVSLIDDREYARQTGVKSRRWFECNANQTLVTNRLLNIYNEVLHA